MIYSGTLQTFLLAGAAVILQAGLALAQISVEPGKLKVGSDLTYPPYNYFATGNVPSGFDVELVTELAKNAGLTPVYVDTRFENLILGVRGGQFDVIASTLYVKPERAKQIDYIPYMKTGVSIAVSAASGLAFTKPEELCGRKVGSIKGAAWLVKLQELNAGVCKDKLIDSREFPTSPEVTQALLSGGVDAQMEDSAVVADAAGKLGGRLKITTTQNFYPVIVGFGVRKGNTELANALRAAMTKAKESGFYDALLKKYNVSAPTDAEFQAAVGG